MSTTFNYTDGAAPAQPMAQGSRSHFSPRRFWHVLKRDLMENPRHDLRVLVGMTLGCLLFMYVAFNDYMTAPIQVLRETGAEVPEEFKQLVLKNMASGVEALFWMFLTFLVSSCFSNLRTKQGRIACFMLPATNLEKFVSRIVKYSVVGSLSMLGCVMLADVLRWAIMCIVHGDGYGFVTPYFFGDLADIGFVTVNIFRENSMEMTAGLYSMVMTCVFFFTLYLLGGMVFRKQPFILTSLVIVVAFVLLGFMFVRMLPAVSVKQFPTWLTEWDSAIYALLVTLMACFDVWLTYRLFKRAGIVTGQGILH